MENPSSKFQLASAEEDGREFQRLVFPEGAPLEKPPQKPSKTNFTRPSAREMELDKLINTAYEGLKAIAAFCSRDEVDTYLALFSNPVVLYRANRGDRSSLTFFEATLSPGMIHFALKPESAPFPAKYQVKTDVPLDPTEKAWLKKVALSELSAQEVIQEIRSCTTKAGDLRFLIWRPDCLLIRFLMDCAEEGKLVSHLRKVVQLNGSN